MIKLALLALVCTLALDYVVAHTVATYAVTLFKQVLEVLP